MKQILAVSLFVLGSSAFLMAGNVTPEIDPSSGAAALALLTGGLAVLRSRRAKK